MTTEGIDLDTVTEKSPDNSRVDDHLRQWGLDPAKIPGLPYLDDDTLDKYTSEKLLRWYIAVRHRKLVMYFGPEHPVGMGAVNDTNQVVDKEISWEDTISTKFGFSLSMTAEAGFFDIVSASVTTTFSAELSQEKKFSEKTLIRLNPGEYGWLTRRGMTTKIEADVIRVVPNNPHLGMSRLAVITGWAGTDGRPESWIFAHARTLNSQVMQLVEQDTTGVITTEDGVSSVPAHLLASLREGSDLRNLSEGHS
jgi:hypothetical protein